MKIINSRGRVLLEVHSAIVIVRDSGLFDIVYQYRGPGIGGTAGRMVLHEKMESIKEKNASAKTVGFLPKPKIR